MSRVTELNLTANAYLTAVTQDDFATAGDILEELSRDDLHCVAAALAGAFNGFLRGLAKTWGEDPDEVVAEAVKRLAFAHATDPSP